jgi:hypothetical protein
MSKQSSAAQRIFQRSSASKLNVQEKDYGLLLPVLSEETQYQQ